MWDKRNKEPIEIKKFMVDLIMEKVINEEDPTEYKKGISSITLDRLDLYAEFATKILLDKIYFYDHFHPEILIKKGLFSDIGTNNVNEFYIPINIDITIDGKTYVDNLVSKRKVGMFFFESPLYLVNFICLSFNKIFSPSIYLS